MPENDLAELESYLEEKALGYALLRDFLSSPSGKTDDTATTEEPTDA